MVVIERLQTALRTKAGLIGVTGIAVVITLSAASWFIRSQITTSKPSTEHADLLTLYKEEVIPSYREKAIELEALQRETKSIDSQLSAILKHMPNWDAKSRQELEQIEELASHLDTHLSNWYVQNRDRINKADQSRARWTKIAQLDRQLEVARRKLGLGPIQK